MDIILSVVIPIYKVEDYLERCVNSVLKQDYLPMEIILVNDGSPDKCPLICDNFASIDNRIKVIHKPNGGLSSARNTGAAAAIGKFIIFMDSDDQWNEGLLRPLMEKVENTNIPLTFFGSLGLYEGGIVMERNNGSFFEEPYRVLQRDDYYKMLIAQGNLHEGASTLVILREFYLKNQLDFKDSIIGEDTEWMFRVLRVVQQVAICDIPLYLYTVGRPGSITQTASTRSVKDTIRIIKWSLEYYNVHTESVTKNWELAHCSYLWSIALGIYNNIPNEVSSNIKKDLKTLRKHLDLSTHPKSKQVGIIYSLFGFYVTTKVLKLYMNLHRLNIINKKKIINGK
ncbi:MAG: glycosyltransferase family 2 protein [Lachnospiraceae bacterium]|nr:glycosyltransferase family 2 protein [Lachnospiraceae bacterium]